MLEIAILRYHIVYRILFSKLWCDTQILLSIETPKKYKFRKCLAVLLVWIKRQAQSNSVKCWSCPVQANNWTATTLRKLKPVGQYYRSDR